MKCERVIEQGSCNIHGSIKVCQWGPCPKLLCAFAVGRLFCVF